MENYIFPFEKLDVWQLAIDLPETVLNLLEKLPQNKHIRLVNQMEAAAVSPAQNIAEGKGRQYKREFIQFLFIARGSIFEVVTLVLQRQIIKNPTPTLTLPLKGRGFYGVFSLHGGDFMGFSHFHGSFSNSSPFKGEVRRGMGYICRCSISYGF